MLSESSGSLRNIQYNYKVSYFRLMCRMWSCQWQWSLPVARSCCVWLYLQPWMSVYCRCFSVVSHFVRNHVWLVIFYCIHLQNWPCVSPGEACCVQVSDWKAASVPAGQLLLPPAPLLQQIPGTDGVCSADHRAGGSAVMRKQWRRKAIKTNDCCCSKAQAPAFKCISADILQPPQSGFE